MEYFMGLVPPQVILNEIAGIQRRYGDNRAEPHITVKAQGGPAPDEIWLAEVEKAARTFEPFLVELIQNGSFRNEIVFFSVESPQLIRLHREIVQRINPSQELLNQYFEKDLYVPHLTIGQASHGYSPEDLNAMRKLADGMVSSRAIVFTAEFLKIYYKSGEASDYQKLKDVKLG